MSTLRVQLPVEELFGGARAPQHGARVPRGVAKAESGPVRGIAGARARERAAEDERAEAIRDSEALALTTRMSRGEHAALDEFYRAWFGEMLAFARAFSRRDEAFCLDVVQEATLRIVRGVGPIETRVGLERWIARVVATAAIDMVRVEARRARRQRGKAELERGARERTPPDVELWARERVDAMLGELRTLRDEERVLLVLRFVEERTLEGAGAAVGVGAMAAHGRIRRALVSLREKMRSRGHV